MNDQDNLKTFQDVYAASSNVALDHPEVQPLFAQYARGLEAKLSE